MLKGSLKDSSAENVLKKLLKDVLNAKISGIVQETARYPIGPTIKKSAIKKSNK